MQSLVDILVLAWQYIWYFYFLSQTYEGCHEPYIYFRAKACHEGHIIEFKSYNFSFKVSKTSRKKKVECPNWRRGEVINQQDYWGLGTWSSEETIFLFPVLLEQANESRADLIRNINRAPRKGETIWNIRVRMFNIGAIGNKPSPSPKTTKGNWIVQLHKYNFNKSWLYIRLCCHALQKLLPPPSPARHFLFIVCQKNVSL